MDASGILDRSKGVKPFLLVDAHASRFSLEFLRYINDESHLWAVCIGVPYGTHLWQVADSEELNGELNRLFTMNKEELLRKKSHHGMDANIVRLDIVPLYNPAWKASFGDVQMNKKAIAAQGWGPLNYFLLDDPGIRKSMGSLDHMNEYTEVFGNRYGQPLPVSNELLETEHDTARMETGSPQSVLGVNDIHLTSRLGKRLMDDIVTGTQSKRYEQPFVIVRR